ncbi:MAG TPA: carboxypeptidase-like regulatory domain-containing protein, partial [Polyangiaceae bacterium]
MSRAKQALLIVAALAGALLLGSLSDTRLRVLEVKEGPLPPVPTFVVKRPARIDVSTSNDRGAAIGGALVRVFTLISDRAYLAGMARTDAGGRATIASLPAAETWILAEADGYARVSTHLVLDDGKREVKLTLTPEQALSVVVADDGAAPLAGASVEAETGDPLPLAAQTNAKGEARLTGLGPPPWDVRVTAPGFDTARETVSATPSEAMRFTLHRLGALEVTAFDPSRHPLPGATVMVVGSGLWPARSGVTDGDGRAKITDLSRGFYDVRAVSGEFVSRVEVGVQLGRGETKSVALRLGLGRRVAVHVRDGEGGDARAVADANVVLAEGGLSSFPLEAKADAHGDASLGPITAGGAFVSAQAAGYVGKAGVAVPDGSNPEVTIALVRGGILSGDVVDARGFPVSGATIEITGIAENGEPISESPARAAFRAAEFSVSLKSESAPREFAPLGALGVTSGPVPPIPHGGPPPAIAQAPVGAALSAPPMPADILSDPWVTAHNGTFRASPVAPGHVRAIVHHPSYLDAASETVTVAASGEAHVHVVLLAGATLEGRVLDDRRMPVTAARVQLVSADGAADRATSTARDGTFAFARVPPDVVLLVSVPDQLGEVALRAPVSVEEGQRKDVELVLAPDRDPLAVTVTGDRGEPLDNAEVLIVS